MQALNLRSTTPVGVSTTVRSSPPHLATRAPLPDPPHRMLDYRQQRNLRRLKTAFTVLFVVGMLLRVGMKLFG